MLCKNCNRHFHACSSCCLRGYEWDYCNEKCWKDSKEYNKIKDGITKLIDYLKGTEHLDTFKELVYGPDYYIFEAEFLLDKFYKDEKTKSQNNTG